MDNNNLMQTKFQVGYKVFVKTDLKVDEKYNGYYFNSEMAQLLGKEVTIIDEMKDFHGRTVYAIAEDANKWWWTLDMLEEIPTEQIEKHVDTCKFYDESMKIKPLPSDIVKAVINGELVRAREMLNELIGDDE